MTITTIFKYPLVLTDRVTLDIPAGAEVLCVQVQNGVPHLWAKVNPKQYTLARCFRIAGTGHELDWKVGKYIGTFQLDGGSRVFHVFEEDEAVL